VTKNRFGTIRLPSSTGSVLQLADTRKCDDVDGTRWFEGAPGRCVAAQRHIGVRPRCMGDVLPD
jgi:hypothetical protein